MIFGTLVLDRETVACLYLETPPSAASSGQQAYVIWLNPADWNCETVEV